jgi:hypothetical protein
MIKKIFILMLAFLLMAGIIFAQTQDLQETELYETQEERVFPVVPSSSGRSLSVTGEMKTGVFWERIEYSLSALGDQCLNCDYPRGDSLVCPRSECGSDVNVRIRARMHNSDDADVNEGRFRLDFHLKDEDLNMGMKVRFEQTAWRASGTRWDYAYVYGNFFNNQLGLSFGRLGDSPWSTGFLPIPVGLDAGQMLNELDKQMGIRTEIRPNFIQGLNFGFVLNGWNNNTPHAQTVGNTLMDVLNETVIGVSYVHEFFHARFAYRLDSDFDMVDLTSQQQEGMDMMYRLEERILRNYIDGLSISANGWWRGIGIDSPRKNLLNYHNWLYIDWAPQEFSSQIRIGYHAGEKRQEIYGGLSFYYNLFPWLSLGFAGNYYENFGENKDLVIGDRSIHRLWSIEPQIRVNLGINSYIALVYSFEQGFLFPNGDRKIQNLNLRTVYTF